MANQFWEGVFRGERLQGLQALRALINQHGDLVGVRLFSDLGAALEIEIPAHRLPELYEALTTLLAMKRLTLEPLASGRELTLFLNVSFSEGKGDLTVATPEVPG